MAANVQTVLSALDVFSSAPDKISLENANTWLQDFQHSVNTLLWSNVPRPQPAMNLKWASDVIDRLVAEAIVS